MSTGQTTAVSGMVADERMMQLLSNNLANSQTPGFKASDGVLMAFPEQLLARVTQAGGPAQPLGPISTGTVFQEGVPQFAGGQLQQTGISTDVAIMDTGGKHSFFAVSYRPATGPTGVALTRDGHFSVSSSHILIDNNGNPVLPVDAAGVPVPTDRIVLNPKYQGTQRFQPNGKPVLDTQGQPSFQVIDKNGNVVTGLQLGTVDANTALLSPLGRGEFMVGGSLNSGSALKNLALGTATLAPGELEGSNVNESQALTKMLPVVQQYQANQQALQDTIQTLNTAVTSIGRVQI